jgi:hypothetical protein
MANLFWHDAHLKLVARQGKEEEQFTTRIHFCFKIFTVGQISKNNMRVKIKSYF